MVDETNQNLDNAQKEILYCHKKLCINIQDLQQLIRPQNVRDHRGKFIYQRPPVVPTKSKRTAHINTRYVWRASWLLTAKTKSSGVVASKPIVSKEGALSRDQYESGDNIATDQFVVKTAGRLLKGCDQEAAHNCFRDGAILQDNTSNPCTGTATGAIG